jgi:anti-sigma-K factor RskA
VNRDPSFDELVGGEPAGAERERLRGAHELLLRAGPPPELTPRLEAGPNVGVTPLRQRQRRQMVRRRTMLLLAAALSIVAVFAAGYAVADHRGGGSSGVAAELRLKGTSAAPNAAATLEVWQPQSGNWPMTLRVAGLPQHARYEVYLVRDGRPWGSCGTFRTAGSSGQLTLKLNAPYRLRKGDSWVVTQLVPGGGEPGKTVLRPVAA